MGLVAISVFAIGAVLYSLIVSAQWRGWALLSGSVIAIYWLQPPLTILPLDFILPTATIILGIVGWFLTRQETAVTREDWCTLGLVTTLLLVLSITGSLVLRAPLHPTSD